MKSGAEKLVALRLRVSPGLRRAIENRCGRNALGLAEGVRRLIEIALEHAPDGSVIRLDGATLERLREFSRRHRTSLDGAAGDLLGQALAHRETDRLDKHPQGSVLLEKLDRLCEETDRLERFMREVARTALGTEMVLAHWAAVAGGTRGANEDQILEEVRKAGEEELRSFLERECPGLLERAGDGPKRPPVH